VAKLTKRQKQIQGILQKQKTVLKAAEAVQILKDFIKESGSKNANQTIELAVQVGVDTKANDQQVRASVVLPSGTGKKKRIAVVAKGEKVKDAKEAGADFVGTEDLIKKIEEGWMDFDVLVATPDCMPMLGKLGRVLGPRGLMPNPKDGTVAADVKKAVTDLQAGKVSFRAEKTGAVIHMPIGKSNFSNEEILANLSAAVQEIQKSKPASSKGTYLKSVFISSTQGPGLRVDAGSLVAA
jgi:large subunit ribosomal protein L1